MRIVFFGTPDFASQILRFLVAENQEIVGVVTRTDKPKGRSLQLAPPPVKEAALELLPNVSLYQPLKASTPEFIDRMRALNPDLFVVVAYGEIMSQELLDVPKIACINIHASLLPKY
ncbi:MAG: methionyl-tRNA formyltransferase, partial [Chlamydiia bacterium]|nr:methionyl-tRNA formyltransferase [Chlamydiia bacterium]